ncbi:Uncharacterised protein [Salmonella enterica subsp. enterica serovar Typhimurium str. DT104]|nr:Uncharacterised protein [Salmonella enterica subsp. enterica serovar Typhimurium str. DT104]
MAMKMGAIATAAARMIWMLAGTLNAVNAMPTPAPASVPKL